VKKGCAKRRVGVFRTAVLVVVLVVAIVFSF
jgi:hypothetical protein